MQAKCLRFSFDCPFKQHKQENLNICRILGRSWDKSLKSFSPCYSPLLKTMPLLLPLICCAYLCLHTPPPLISSCQPSLPVSLQRQFRLYIPFLGIVRPQPQFPHSCVCERFIYSLDRSTYFIQQKRQTHRGNI